MKISERLKRVHPEITDCRVRGDGTVILVIKKDEKEIKKEIKRAITSDEMRTFYALMRIAESSANDYLYVKLTEVAKEIEDEN